MEPKSKMSPDITKKCTECVNPRDSNSLQRVRNANTATVFSAETSVNSDAGTCMWAISQFLYYATIRILFLFILALLAHRGLS
jgi:hypothetical protein